MIQNSRHRISRDSASGASLSHLLSPLTQHLPQRSPSHPAPEPLHHCTGRPHATCGAEWRIADHCGAARREVPSAELMTRQWRCQLNPVPQSTVESPSMARPSVWSQCGSTLSQVTAGAVPCRSPNVACCAVTRTGWNKHAAFLAPAHRVAHEEMERRRSRCYL